MTRVHALFACLILIAAPLAGCVSEDLIDDIVGCMDENAANYNDNATSELVGDCIYMATMDAFIDAMSDVRSIEEMLEDTPKAGYAQSITMNEYSAELGMQMDIQIDERVMADLDNDAVHVYNSFAFVPMMTMEYTHVQVGEVVNVHYAVGGMMGEAESGSYQTRDATPNVMEVLSAQVGLFSGGDEDEGMLVETPDADVDEIPEDAVTTITLSDNMETQTMTMEYTEDGQEITMIIHINMNEDLMSFSMDSDNGSATMSMTYEMMWGDAVVIEVNETLPKTSIPVWIDVDPWDDDDDGDDTFLCDNGNEIPWDYVDDGWDDCGDGSDESDDGGGDEVVYICDDGEEIPFDWVNDGYPDCYDESDEATYEDGEVGEPNFVSYLDCWQFMNTSMVQNDAADEWDGTNLDMSDCGGESTEYYDDYVIGDTPVTAPYSISTIISEEGWSEMTGDDTGDYCEYEGGSYDADNDVCTLIIEMTRNETHLLDPIHNWMEESGASDEDEASMYCTDWTEGSYDADEDICTTIWAVIMDADGGALLLDDGDWVLDFYFYDASTGSGFRVNAEYGLQCDNGQIVHEWAYDDGWEDCEDGSDEPGQGEETSEFVCMDGTVIPFSWVNDWEEDCPDGSDEQWYYQDDVGDDDNGPPTPEEAMYDVDTDGDGYMDYQEFQDAWDSDPTNPELDYDEVSILFDDCDYDDNDLIDIEEMQCFIDGIVDMFPDEGDEDPEQMFGHIDTDDDGYMSLQDIIDFSNNEAEQDGEEPMSSEDEEGLSEWFSWCDTDGDDLLNLDEFTTCVEDDDDDDEGDEMFTCDNGDEIPMDWVNDGWDDCGDGSDESDNGDNDQHDTLPPVITGSVAKNQTLNAPISDFEVHFLSDCYEEYDEDTGEMVEPDLNECTVAFSIPLTGGESNGVTHTYTDLDGDGLVSPGDLLTLEGYDGQTRLEMYDTWASEYSSDSVANPPALPGFGALMALTVMLGAAFATRRD